MQRTISKTILKRRYKCLCFHNDNGNFRSRYNDPSLYMPRKWYNFRRNLVIHRSIGFKLRWNEIHRVHWASQVFEIHRFCTLTVWSVLVENSWMVHFILPAWICHFVYCVFENFDSSNFSSFVSWMGSIARYYWKGSLDRITILGYFLLYLHIFPFISSTMIFRAILEFFDWILTDYLFSSCCYITFLSE